jgi:predicted phosphodiesterase
MMLRRADATAPRRAEHGRASHASARARAKARGVAGDVFHHRIDETFELRFGDRFHALRGEADGEAGDGEFVERRVDDAFAAERLLQSLRRAEHAAIDADVFAEHDDARSFFIS